MPLVTVILPSYGMGKFVPEALASVGAQTHGDWEVILVDDCGPEDGTREAVESLAREHPSKRVEYIRNEENVGAGQSRNIGIDLARGEFLAFLDPDDFWDPNFLEHAVRGIGDADLCFCRCWSVDEAGNDLGAHMGGRMEELIAGLPESLFLENFLIPSSSFVRRDVPERFGFFPTRQDATYAEDWDLYLRCILGGARFAFLDGKYTRYRRHPGGATSNYLIITSECVRVLRKNWRVAPLWAKRSLAASLHTHLCRLAYLRVSFREWSGLANALEALRIKPFDAAPFVQVVKGLRNNWKDLR